MSNYHLHGIMLSGPVYKVALALNLMGETFTYHHVNLRAGEHKKPEFLALNRFGQVPALEDKSKGVVLCQSAAIMQYLAQETGKMGGTTAQEQAHVREWLFWDFDKLSPPIFRIRAQRIGLRPMHQAISEMYHVECKLALDSLESQLAGKEFLAGKAVTIADCAIYGTLSYIGQAGVSLVPFPNITGFMHRIEAQQGFAPAAKLIPMPV
jgi:glutathione S-transferase